MAGYYQRLDTASIDDFLDSTQERTYGTVEGREDEDDLDRCGWIISKT